MQQRDGKSAEYTFRILRNRGQIELPSGSR
jgi:hypothetical protein